MNRFVRIRFHHGLQLLGIQQTAEYLIPMQGLSIYTPSASLLNTQYTSAPATTMKADFVSWKPTFIPLESNIFLQIFRNKEDAVRKMKQTTKMYQDTLHNINKAIEEITLLTLDKDSKSSLEFLPTLTAASRGQTWLDLELLDAAIFQRLLYMNVKKVGQESKQPVEEPGQFIYLFQCYTR